MSLSRVNASAATLTKNRTEGSIVPASGMCVTCVDGCIGMCEIGKSAIHTIGVRAREGARMAMAAIEEKDAVEADAELTTGSVPASE